MKRYIRSDTCSKLDFDTWYDNWIESDSFIRAVEKNLIADLPTFANIEEEPSIQGYRGKDLFYITFKDDTTKVVSVDWENLIEYAFEHGDEAAGEYYAQRIIEMLD